MKQITLLVIAMLINSGILYAQGIAINADGSAPNGSAMLDVKATDKGILIPRLTNFNSDDIKLEYWDGSKWKTMVTKTSSSGSSSDGNSFCSEGLTDYDGHKYKTVKIGDQCCFLVVYGEWFWICTDTEARLLIR